MKVLKAINNNVVSCVDDDGCELVVMGRGLGFRSKPGDELAADAAEKIFRMDSPNATSRFKALLSQLPTELLELCTRIIDHAGQVLGRQLNQTVYLTLTDHISFAISRANSGTAFHNALLTEIRVFYPGEFAVGKYALELIHSEMGVSLSEDEAANIALHLINAQYDGSLNSTMRSVQVLKPVLAILHSWEGLKLVSSRLAYDELIVHLKFMAMQVFSGENSDWVHPALTTQVHSYFPREYACAKAITTYLTEQCGSPVPAAEVAYLAICIHRACI